MDDKRLERFFRSAFDATHLASPLPSYREIIDRATLPEAPAPGDDGG